MPPVSGREHPGHYDHESSNYQAHISRSRDTSMGGIDYRPFPFAGTYICPVAKGIVGAAIDDHPEAGMLLVVAHGLGWHTLYAHLHARFVDVRSRIDRRDVVAVMGKSGIGANRADVPGAVHLHLSLYGPVYAALYAGIAVQERPEASLRFRCVLDPEEFSLAGKGRDLPYPDPGDWAAVDEPFLKVHDAAVRFCDDLLARMTGDAEAGAARQRTKAERALQFESDVDQRIWFLWQRLQTGRHPFSPTEVAEYRATLRGFMCTVPRLTAPVVEPEGQGKYYRVRATPLKTYRQPLP
jgi:murein DD-endopeptidase MepM/ murein hydrolase activator NlpD